MNSRAPLPGSVRILLPLRQEGIAPALALHETVVSCLINELFDIIFSFCTCLLLYSAHMYCNVRVMDSLRYQSCQSDTETPTQMVPKAALEVLKQRLREKENKRN